MGTSEKQLYEEYLKVLKKKGIKQFNNEQIKGMLKRKGDKHD